MARDGKIPKSVNLPLGSLKKALLADCEDFDVSYGFPKPEKHNENVIFYRYDERDEQNLNSSVIIKGRAVNRNFG